MTSDVSIRTATIDDRDEIVRVVNAAFGDDAEVMDICQKSWASPDYLPDLELVAVSREGEIVGHVLHALGRVDDRPLPGLAPLGVRPDQQRQGVGGALLREAIARADAAGHAGIFLLGHPSYYPRFGFEPAMPLGIIPLGGETFTQPEAAMIRRLSAYDSSWRGRFRYCWELDAATA